MEATSALTGPSQMSQISLIRGMNSRPDLAMIEGFVVTPSKSPYSAKSLISFISDVSAKNFMVLSYPWFI